MTDIALRLKAEALRLSEEDRVDLANALMDSLEGQDVESDPDADAWIAELERRSADANAGRSAEQPYRQVIAELRGEQP